MKLRYLITVLAFSISSGAFAAHCPLDMKKIDAALEKGPALSSGQLAKVKQLRSEGEALHSSGNHQGSVDKLGQAMQILGIE